MNRDTHFSSATDSWATPPAVFATLDAEFAFTLDAAASPSNAKAKRYYTETDDGLAQPWTGTVWCNPPYGRTIGKWVEKAIRSTRQGATVVMLVPARTDSIWFQQLFEHADEIRFAAGRLRFGDATEPAPFPSALAVLRPPRDWGAVRDRITYRMPTRHEPGMRWTSVRRTD